MEMQHQQQLLSGDVGFPAGHEVPALLKVPQLALMLQ